VKVMPIYPQLSEYGKRVKDLFEEGDINKDGVLSLQEFQDLLKSVDSHLKNYPATAQVAAQQGVYLANLFNSRAKNQSKERPFIYKHKGSLAYVGGNSAVAEVGQWRLGGFATWWMWRSIYLTKQFSFRNRMLVCSDWFRTIVFGRDNSRF